MRRSSIITAVVVAASLAAGLWWASWFYDGCRGVTTQSGGCNEDFGTIGLVMTTVGWVTVLIASAAVGLAVAWGITETYVLLIAGSASGSFAPLRV